MVVDDEHILLVGHSHGCVDRRVDALVLLYQEEIAWPHTHRTGAKRVSVSAPTEIVRKGA